MKKLSDTQKANLKLAAELLCEDSTALVKVEKALSLVKGISPKAEKYLSSSIEIIAKIRAELVRKKEASVLFGSEVGDKFKGALGSITQTFDGYELYHSLEEKAAHLLYLIIKDHPFVDGNKRIGSILFIYYLDKNHALFTKTGERAINDTALTALALLIAVSEPKEKDVMISLIMRIIAWPKN